jgi:hypothetical protein
MSLLKTRRLRANDRHAVLELVARLTAGEDPRPSPDFDRLTESEAVDLVEFCERVNRGEAEPDQKFWRLVAASAGFDRDHFERRAAEAKAARKECERSARERRMPFGRRETTNLFLELFRALEADDLWLDDVVTIVAVLVQLAAGKPLISTSTIEGSAATGDLALVVNANMGLIGGADGSSIALGWQARAKYLAEEGWLGISGRGPIRRITLGPKLRALVELTEP